MRAKTCHHGYNQFLLEGHVVAHREAGDTPDMAPRAFTLEIALQCGICGERFTFEGIPAGDPDELSRPVVNTSLDRLRVPVRPVDAVDRRHYPAVGILPVIHLSRHKV